MRNANRLQMKNMQERKWTGECCEVQRKLSEHGCGKARGRAEQRSRWDRRGQNEVKTKRSSRKCEDKQGLLVGAGLPAGVLSRRVSTL